jgi:hypothetical protein
MIADTQLIRKEIMTVETLGTFRYEATLDLRALRDMVIKARRSKRGISRDGALTVTIVER